VPNANTITQYEPLRATKENGKKITSITRDPKLVAAFGYLVTALMAGEPGDDNLWDAFAGTPTLLSPSGEPDDSGLIANPVWQAALALAGVVKWVFCSWYEHLFAVRAIGGLLALGKCPLSLEPQAKVVRPTIANAEFYWAPVDHHNHWHVVFAVS